MTTTNGLVPATVTVGPRVASATLQHTPPSSKASSIRAAVASLLPLTRAERLKFQRATDSFPGFCHEWEQKLHDREQNNLAHLKWQARGGYETATYVGYSDIESCETKPARTTVIGKLTYDEINYYLVGKTIDEAKHAKPKLVSKMNTLEIFSWDKNRWFY